MNKFLCFSVGIHSESKWDAEKSHRKQIWLIICIQSLYRHVPLQKQTHTRTHKSQIYYIVHTFFFALHSGQINVCIMLNPRPAGQPTNQQKTEKQIQFVLILKERYVVCSKGRLIWNAHWTWLIYANDAQLTITTNLHLCTE